MTDNDGLGGQTAASEAARQPRTRPQHYRRDPLFPRWSIPILAAILGLTLAIARYADPTVEVYYVPDGSVLTTTTTPSGDNVEVTP